MSYTIDVYRRKLAPTDSFLRFSLYVAFFPQLVAGPIVRASELLPQFEKGPAYTDQRNKEGALMIATGFIKKMVLADNLSPFVNMVYAAPALYSGDMLLLATYAFAFQIYLDFSGYTDIARGTARLLGFDIGLNFAKPYFSQSITEFWRRWHISLSSWLRDYLYISLGGNRKGKWKTYRNLMLTMLLGGIWHGAAWTFVWWGLFHGVFLMIERVIPMKRMVPGDGVLSQTLRRVITFHLVCVSWVLFRAESMSHALDVMGGIFSNPWSWSLNTQAAVVFGLIAFTLLALMADAGDRVFRAVYRSPRPLRYAAYFLAAFLVIGFGVWNRAEFIYFQF
jgi:alginate O-acetyltransferase complex protein AlgI